MPAFQLDEKAIFNIARQLASRDARAEYLAQVTGDNAALRERIIARIDGFEKQHSFLNSPVSSVAATIDLPPLTERPGTQIGPYKLVEEIGEGGMGIVYMAVQKEPVRRKVALKIIKPGMDTREVIARFEAEQQALALMDHPNIAKVHDAGTTESSRPYFVMELVNGVSITQYCDDNNLPTRDRLELFTQVCHAVQHAHQKGIIHRDLKPSNVLVTLHDGVPVPKIIDFGIAKAIGGGLMSDTLATGFGQMLGTPLYMSPEQAERSGLDIDTRSDIYSLGVLLYELLTGSTPFERGSLKDLGLDELRRVIREEEPPRPSTRISTMGMAATTVSEHRRTTPVELSNSLRHELDWIVMKALDKDRTRRYATANDFARDIQRYLHDEAVEACPPSTVYRVRKFTRRHQGAVIATTAVSLALLLGAGMATWQAVRASEHARQAEGERDRAQATLHVALRALDKMYTEVAEKQIIAAPMAEPMRIRLLEEAIRFYTDFAAIHAADPDLRYEQAKAYMRLGRCQQWLGQVAEAKLAQRTALQEFEKLVAESPSVADYQLGLAGCCIELGNLHRDVPEGEALLQRALAVLEPLRPTMGDNRDYPFYVARAYRDLGWHQECVGRHADAEAPLRQALALCEKLVSDSPEDAQKQFYLAQTCGSLAVVLQAVGRTEDAEAHYRKSIQMQEQVVALPPVDPSHRFNLFYTYLEYARFLEQLNRTAEAEDRYRQSLRLTTELAADYPHVPDYPMSWRVSYTALTRMLQKAGRKEDAASVFRQVIDAGEALATRWPTVNCFQQNLCYAYNDFCSLLIDCGKNAEALQAMDQGTLLAEKIADDTVWHRKPRDEVAGAKYRQALRAWTSGERSDAQTLFAEALQIQRGLLPDNWDSLAPENVGAITNMHNLAWRLVTCPDPQIRAPREAMTLAKKAVDLIPSDAALMYKVASMNTLGVALYRVGDYPAAIEILQKSLAVNERRAYDGFFLSMAHWQMNHLEESKRFYDEAVTWMKEYEPNNQELQVFEAEAAELLGLREALPSAGKPDAQDNGPAVSQGSVDESEPKKTPPKDE